MTFSPCGLSRSSLPNPCSSEVAGCVGLAWGEGKSSLSFFISAKSQGLGGGEGEGERGCQQLSPSSSGLGAPLTHRATGGGKRDATRGCRNLGAKSALSRAVSAMPGRPPLSRPEEGCQLRRKWEGKFRSLHRVSPTWLPWSQRKKCCDPFKKCNGRGGVEGSPVCLQKGELFLGDSPQLRG